MQVCLHICIKVLYVCDRVQEPGLKPLVLRMLLIITVRLQSLSSDLRQEEAEALGTRFV